MVSLLLLSTPIFLIAQTIQFTFLLYAVESLAHQLEFIIALTSKLMYVAAIFWGLWLIPLAALVYYSGFIPRSIGILLLLGSFGYIIRFIQSVVWPGTEASLWSNPFLMITHIAELTLMTWLLLKGIKPKQT